MTVVEHARAPFLLQLLFLFLSPLAVIWCSIHLFAVLIKVRDRHIIEHIPSPSLVKPSAATLKWHTNLPQVRTCNTVPMRPKQTPDATEAASVSVLILNWIFIDKISEYCALHKVAVSYAVV